MNRVTLVGFRASGKSTVGRLLAARLAWPFVDADTVVEARLGMSIAAYFKTHGEAAFREQEASVLRDILADDRPLVLATGGGAVLRDDNRQLLRTRGGLVAWLRADVGDIQERLRHHAGGRPSLTGTNVVDEVPMLLAAREPWYAEVAQHVVVSSGRSAAAAADAIALAMRERA